MNREDWERLLEVRRWRGLHPVELDRARAWMADHPDDRAAWEDDEALDALLDETAELEPSPRFMDGIWRQIDASAAGDAGFDAGEWFSWMRLFQEWWPRIGWTCSILTVAWVLWWREADRQRVMTADCLMPVVEMAKVPSVEALRDFDAIRSLGEPMVGGDMDLLEVLEEIK